MGKCARGGRGRQDWKSETGREMEIEGWKDKRDWRRKEEEKETEKERKCVCGRGCVCGCTRQSWLSD